MKILAIDVGNSGLKFDLFENGRSLGRSPFQAPDLVAVSSVNPPVLKRLLPRLRALGVRVRIAGRDLRIPFPHPPEAGSDRLLGAYAAWRRARGPVLVIDVGTAITLNIMDARGRFLGGAIFAGPRLALEALAARTALLPRVLPAGRRPRPGQDSRIARDTRGALQAGAFLACRGFAREGLAAATRALGRRPAVFLTGGGAGFLEGAVPGALLAPQLVLEGLALLAAK